MGDFFKSFGKGILYLVLLPVIIVVLAIYGIAGLFGFIFLFFKSIILFFTGRSLYDDLPEDKEAYRRIHGDPVPETVAETPEPEKSFRDEYSVYHPEVDPFSVKSANQDPHEETIEEHVWGKDYKNEPIKEQPTPEPFNDVEEENIPQPDERIESSLDDLLEEPAKVETPIPEMNIENNTEGYQEISTGEIDNSNKYTPRGSEELFSIDEDEQVEEDDSLGISFDDM